MRTRITIASLLVVAALSLSGCGGSGSDGSDGAKTGASTTTTKADGTSKTTDATKTDPVKTDEVEITGLAFSPKVITVKVGDTVTWTNNDSTAHTVAIDDDEGFGTGTIEAGTSAMMTFQEPGTFTYHCEVHSSMTGTIVITK